jgi:ketosteroid isomerase-like protein
MKKLSILTLFFAALSFVLISVCVDSNAQSAKKVRNIIIENNANYVRWFNSGQVDSLLTIYRDDACMVGYGCGKAYIQEHMEAVVQAFRFEEMNAVSISVADSIAVERGRFVISINAGGRINGEYLTEWRRKKKKWQIVNDISSE